MDPAFIYYLIGGVLVLVGFWSCSGNSIIALYNPPLRVAEEFAMLDVLSGGRLVAGFPVGTSMDTNYCLRHHPGADAREVRRGA